MLSLINSPQPAQENEVNQQVELLEDQMLVKGGIQMIHKFVQCPAQFCERWITITYAVLITVLFLESIQPSKLWCETEM